MAEGGTGHLHAVSSQLGGTCVRSNILKPWNKGRMNKVHKSLRSLSGHPGQWTCFFCCHVRTGTIILGFWYMLLYLMALSVFAVMVVYPEMLGHQSPYSANDDLSLTIRGNLHDIQATNCTEMPCSLAKLSNTPTLGRPAEFAVSLEQWLASHKMNREDANVALFITLSTFVVTLLMVYGAFKGQPYYLMPFFFLQVFDFCISSMTMIGYLSYLPNVRQLIHEASSFPFQDKLLAMNTKCLTFFVILVFIATFMIKAYCINIVWRCYKFLTMRGHHELWVLHHLEALAEPAAQDVNASFVSDLPDYETCMRDQHFRKKSTTSLYESPPAYDAAMAILYAEEQEISTLHQSSAVDGAAPLLDHQPVATVSTVAPAGTSALTIDTTGSRNNSA